MFEETDRAGESASLAAAIASEVDRRNVETANLNWWLVLVSVGLFVMFMVATLASPNSSEDAGIVLALAALVTWIGPPVAFHRTTESTVLKLISAIPGWGLLILLGYAVGDYLLQYRRLRSVGADLDEIEQHVHEGDRLARNGEYDAAQSAYDRATTAVDEARTNAEDQDLEGMASVATSLGRVAASKQLAAKADVSADGVFRHLEDLEERLERAKGHLEEENYDEALDEYDSAIGALESLQHRTDFAGDWDWEPPVVRRVFSTVEDMLDDANAGRETALAGQESIAFDQRLADAQSAGDRGDSHYDGGEHEAAIDAYDDGIDACEEALSLAERDGVGDRRNAEMLLEDLQRRRAGALLSHIGQQIESVPGDPAPDEIEATVDRVSTLLETAETATITDGQERDRELVARDAARAMVETAEAGLNNLVERETQRFEAGEYEQARDGFDRGRGIADQVLEAVSSYDVEGESLADLADLCEQNADNARRAKLGIGDGDGSLRQPRTQQVGETATSAADGAGGTGHAAPSRRVARSVDAVADEVFAGYPVPEDIPVAPDIDVDIGAVTRGERLGAGGNADVTLATVDSPEGPVEVALKEPRFQETVAVDEADEFIEEAETWAKIDDHEHIVGLADYGGEPLPWIAMEYMEAGDLSARTEDFEVSQALWSAYGITRAVRHAHRRGIQHYDLKPGNVLFRSVEDAWDVPKVTDWGLAKHLLDHSGTVEGYTPTYAAPEQLDPDRYGDPDERTDIYQLGVLFYEVFTGRPPFEGGTGAVIQAHLDEEPAPASDVNPALPAGLDDVLDVALKKDKRDRHESVLYLRDGLMSVAEESL